VTSRSCGIATAPVIETCRSTNSGLDRLPLPPERIAATAIGPAVRHLARLLVLETLFGLPGS
jgi:hypothetical protein